MSMNMPFTKAQAEQWLAKHDDVRFEGASPLDVVYTHQTQGTYNTQRMRQVFEKIEAAEPAKLDKLRIRAPITENMIEVNAVADVSAERVAAMPLAVARANRPIWIECPGGTAIMADGNHTIRRLIAAGDLEVKGYYVPWDLAQHFRVRTRFHLAGTPREGPSAVWEEMPLEMDLALMEGDFRHHEPEAMAAIGRKLGLVP